MSDQQRLTRVHTTPLSRQILQRRDALTMKAEQAAADAQSLSAETFTLFCESNGLPVGSRLAGFDGDDVLVELPPQSPSPSAQ